MNIERLNLMIEMLEEIQKNPKHKENELICEFDLDDWTCDTSACAIGYAMFDSRFPELIPNENKSPICDEDFSSNWGAVQAYFGISRDDAEYLFAESQYDIDSQEPIDVANRIRLFIQDDS